MARVQNTLIGRSSGSVGEVVFLTWKHINVTRSKPTSVANPDTLPQQKTRNKFLRLQQYFKQLKPLVNVGFKGYARKKSPNNIFYQENVNSSITTSPSGNVIFTPSIFKISKGSLLATPIISVIRYAGAQELIFTWPTDLQANQSADDIVKVCAYTGSGNVFSILDSSVIRSAGTITLPLVTNPNPIFSMYAWMFFVNSKSGKVSDSVYRIVNNV